MNEEHTDGEQPEVEQPPVYQVIAAIKEGRLDERLGEIKVAIQIRQEDRKEEVATLVREVFGPDAEITVPKSGSLERLSDLVSGTVRPNPFEEKAKTEGTETRQLEDDRVDTTDALSHLDDTERKMIEEEGGSPEPIQPQPVGARADYIPPEQRGARISGLHSSDIAE